MDLTYEYARETAGETGQMLIEMINGWKLKRGDIDYGDTEKGFNIDLKTEGRKVTVLVFWGRLDQPKSRIMMSRQDKYPSFAKIDELDRNRINGMLKEAGFESTLGKYSNARLEYANLPKTSLEDVIKGIDNVVSFIKGKCEN